MGVARVKFSMAGRVIRYQRSDIGRRGSGEQRPAISDQEARKCIRRVHGGHRVRREEKSKSEEKRSGGVGT
jgi:hypothetical protein